MKDTVLSIQVRMELRFPNPCRHPSMERPLTASARQTDGDLGIAEL